jgi:hypothetical protein
VHPEMFNRSLAENALNIIMAKCVSITNLLHLIDNKFHLGDAFFDLKTNSIAPILRLRGYAYNVRGGTGDILLNIGPATSAFWLTILVSQVLSAGLCPFDRERMALRGTRVYTT